MTTATRLPRLTTRLQRLVDIAGFDPFSQFTWSNTTAGLRAFRRNVEREAKRRIAERRTAPTPTAGICGVPSEKLDPGSVTFR